MSMISLAANTPFTACFHETDGQYSDQHKGAKFTLTDSSCATLGLFASMSNTQDTSFSLGNNFVPLTGITDATGAISDATGAISDTYQAHVGGAGDFNDAQFVVGSATPEPSQWAGLAITAFGALGLIVKVRWKIVTA